MEVILFDEIENYLISLEFAKTRAARALLENRLHREIQIRTPII